MIERSTLHAEFERITGKTQYMVLATTDAAGLPWASPVWFAANDGREFYWVSRPEARHSRNLAVRPELGIAIFDSTQPAGTGEGVYVSAIAGLVPDDEIDTGIEIFSNSLHGSAAGSWSRPDVEPPARLRLYRATARERFLLDSSEQRVLVPFL